MVSSDKSIKNDIALVIILTLTLIITFILRSNNFYILNIIVFVISLVATTPVIISASNSLKKNKVSVDLLASVALVFSIINQEWFSAIFINLMITSARIFSKYSEKRAQDQIRSLLKLKPTHVKLKIGKSTQIIPLSQLKAGDEIIVEVGDRIPADSLVISGQAAIDQSSLTGESIPVSKTIGDRVLTSTLNVSGSLTLKVEKTGEDTTFEKIIKLIESAKEEKQGIHTLVEKFSSVYILITFFGAIILYFVSRNTNLVLSVLLVTCADDIAIAIPMAFWIAIGYAAQRGIVIKGGSYLEGLSKAKSVILDKTGTLTKGNLVVDQIISLSDLNEKEILSYAYTLESLSNHPIAKAICAYGLKSGLNLPLVPSVYFETPGLGMNTQNIFVGSLEFIKKYKIKIHKAQLDQIYSFQDQGLNVVLVSKNKKLIGLILLSSELREQVSKTLKLIYKYGVRHFIMLTGDSQRAANRIASDLNIKEYHANLLPQDKLSLVKTYLAQNSYRKLVFIGDGVNDAASLSIADVGIAMGAIGSDAAIESADIALMDDDFSKISETISLSHHLMKIVQQNFIIWGVVNALGLFLVFTHVLNPASAAAYNFISDFFPLLNSFRLFKYRLTPGKRLY